MLTGPVALWIESCIPFLSESSDVHDHHGPGLAQVTGDCSGTVLEKPMFASGSAGGSRLPMSGITRMVTKSKPVLVFTMVLRMKGVSSIRPIQVPRNG